MSKDFYTPAINEVCSGSQEGKFDDRTRAQKFAHCYYRLELLRLL